MNTIFGNFIEKIIPTLRKATLKLNISGQETEMTVEDFASQIAPEPYEPPYKVFTALLTQTGGNNPQAQMSGSLEIGRTYRIDDQSGGTWDFTNVGSPNNDIGTYFVATGTTPNNWGNGTLIYNLGAPIVTVLENTIGNIWFTYVHVGNYDLNSNGLFTENKTVQFINSPLGLDEGILLIANVGNTDSSIRLTSTNKDPAFVNGYFDNTPIEIRVYN